MNGLYKVKNPILSQIKQTIDNMLENTNSKFKHVLRDKNKIADEQANIGIDSKNKIPEKFIKFLAKYEISI